MCWLLALILRSNIPLSLSSSCTVASHSAPIPATASLQFKKEYMSTRLGVKRKAEITSATERTADDGRIYYDIRLRARSFASRNQLAVSQREIDAGTELEWDRQYLTVLGTANGRLYSMRLQAPISAVEGPGAETLQKVADSFRCTTVES